MLRPSSSSTVHPHSRGDNECRVCDLHQCSGTPPLAWGQRVVWARASSIPWYTPTRVGTTLWHQTNLHDLTVHPHSRGDNDCKGVRVWRYTGTPPLAWGQPLGLGAWHHCMRYTPTRVGTTGHVWPKPRLHPVHPHSRGDNNTSADAP